MENQNLPQGQITNIVADSLNINPGTTTENAAPADIVSETANDLLQAALASGSHLEDGIKLPSLGREAGSEGTTTEEEVRALREKMMRRAAKQREQGSAGLAKAESGTAILQLEAVIKSRQLSSAFLRWFSAIDQCVANVQRRGEMLLGEAKSADLLEALRNQIEAVAADAQGELARVQKLVKDSRDEDVTGMFVMPTVIQPAITMNVNIRTKLGKDLYRALRNYDDALELMQALYWNDVMTEKQAQEQEHQYKKSFGGLYKYAARTNISLFQRFTKRGVAKGAELKGPNEDTFASTEDALKAA